MRIYKINELIVGLRFFDKNKRPFASNDFVITPENIDQLCYLEVTLSVIEVIPPHDVKESQNQLVVRSPNGSHQYTLDLNNQEGFAIFEPFIGMSLHRFVDARDFFRNFRGKQSLFEANGKKKESVAIWELFYKELNRQSELWLNSKRVSLVIVGNDFEVKTY